MAIWQFGFYLVPTNGIIKEHGHIPPILDQYKSRDEDTSFNEEQQFRNYWSNSDIPAFVKEQISKRLPLMKSWSKEAEMYGSDDGSKVEIWEDDIICLVDARNCKYELLEILSNIAFKLDCKLVLKGCGKVIDADYQKLLKEFENSVARKFVLNPRSTLRNLSK
ncbi:hypothetical protein [Spartinivicinus ruber]|uniref:hypothetical protein n=1 Tax=Spartinivicinus ruber TaxID=2683272 RepID=UPI0013D4BE8E|nr:hypothetical protein [Spartinivicinus ruber]